MRDIWVDKNNNIEDFLNSDEIAYRGKEGNDSVHYLVVNQESFLSHKDKERLRRKNRRAKAQRKYEFLNSRDYDYD